jgi:hypothetical protein
VNYIEDVASRIRAELPPSAIPSEDSQLLFLLYALLALTKGDQVTREDVHDAWSTWMTARGENDHDSLLRFDSLSDSKQRLDEPYVRAVREVAQRLASE